MAEGDAPVVVTAGSGNSGAHDFFAAAIDACARVGRRAFLLTPHREQLPDVLPAHATHLDFVPFHALFPRAAAVVHHGGVGTCAQAFAAGAPQLVVPMSTIYDQTNNAMRVERLGAGIALARRTFAESAGDALARLLSDDAIASRCRAIAAIARAPQRSAAVALEDYVASIDRRRRTGTVAS